MHLCCPSAAQSLVGEMSPDLRSSSDLCLRESTGRSWPWPNERQARRE